MIKTVDRNRGDACKAPYGAGLQAAAPYSNYNACIAIVNILIQNKKTPCEDQWCQSTYLRNTNYPNVSFNN
jgi:hypothetical protein